MYQDDVEVFVDRKVANRSRRQLAKQRSRSSDFEPRMRAVGVDKPDKRVKMIEHTLKNVNPSDLYDDYLYSDDFVAFEKRGVK